MEIPEIMQIFESIYIQVQFAMQILSVTPFSHQSDANTYSMENCDFSTLVLPNRLFENATSGRSLAFQMSVGDFTTH